MANRKLGVGVLGAHTWAEKAHLPGYAADPRVDLVAHADYGVAGGRHVFRELLSAQGGPPTAIIWRR